MKPKLTLAEHQQLATRIRSIQNELSAMLSLVNRLPKSHPAARNWTRAISSSGPISMMKSALDTQLFIDCPGEADSHLYYGRSQS